MRGSGSKHVRDINILLENLNGTGKLGDLRIYGSIILKYNLEF